MTDTLQAKNETIHEPEAASARVSRVRNFDPLKPPTDKPQSYYDEIEKRFGEERDVRWVTAGANASIAAIANGTNS